ncbi:MAG: hypothetical protein KJZ58_13790 [Flavobacteriales bacterium]|jgi:hypothetical protein|nr:hypothetical protein [Flavobacteriales bacterium]
MAKKQQGAANATKPQARPPRLGKAKGRARLPHKSLPKSKPRKILDASKYAGTVPGIAGWALDEVREMRDDW